jgi:hypothetical protein
VKPLTSSGREAMLDALYDFENIFQRSVNCCLYTEATEDDSLCTAMIKLRDQLYKTRLTLEKHDG